MFVFIHLKLISSLSFCMLSFLCLFVRQNNLRDFLCQTKTLAFQNTCTLEAQLSITSVSLCFCLCLSVHLSVCLSLFLFMSVCPSTLLSLSYSSSLHYNAKEGNWWGLILKLFHFASSIFFWFSWIVIDQNWFSLHLV